MTPNVTITITAPTLGDALAQLMTLPTAAPPAPLAQPAVTVTEPATRRRRSTKAEDQPSDEQPTAEPEKPVFSVDDVKKKLIAAAEATGNPNTPIDLLAKFDAKKVSEVPINKFAELIAAADELIAPKD